MKIKHAFFFLLGAIPVGAVIGYLVGVFTYSSRVDVIYTDHMLEKILTWIFITWMASMTARIMQLLDEAYQGKTHDTYSRKTYVGYGALSYVFLFLAFFFYNPVWAIMRNIKKAIRDTITNSEPAKKWKEFWRQEI